MRRRRRLWPWLVLFCLMIFAVSLAPPARTYILRSAGWLLVVEDQPPVKSADIIVVAIDADGAGTLEAADLVHRGVSAQVAVFEDRSNAGVDREFLRRGLPYEDRAAISTRQLHSLGVQNVEQIARVSGSEQEGHILPNWCDKRGYHSAVLVTSSDHSRRLSRILRRSLHGHQTRITILSSPYSEFTPDGWWKTRAGVRVGIFEFEKLLLDFLLHPFS